MLCCEFIVPFATFSYLLNADVKGLMIRTIPTDGDSTLNLGGIHVKIIDNATKLAGVHKYTRNMDGKGSGLIHISHTLEGINSGCIAVEEEYVSQ